MKKTILLCAGLLLLAGCSGKSGATIDDMTPDYTGVYLDEYGTDNNLIIKPDSMDGYHVSIAIHRLTLLDDGHGQATADGLAFTATDASGKPIGGIITISGDTAIVTFTDSHWIYLPNGEQFRYYKSPTTSSSTDPS